MSLGLPDVTSRGPRVGSGDPKEVLLLVLRQVTFVWVQIEKGRLPELGTVDVSSTSRTRLGLQMVEILDSQGRPCRLGVVRTLCPSLRSRVPEEVQYFSSVYTNLEEVGPTRRTCVQLTESPFVKELFRLRPSVRDFPSDKKRYKSSPSSLLFRQS